MVARRPSRGVAIGPPGRVALAARRLADLAPAEYNARRISDEALGGLGRSIDHFGVVVPLVVNRRSAEKGWPAGSKETIVGGHMRLRALLERGVAETDVVLVDLTAAEERALNVAMNSGSISGEWTSDALALIDEIAASLPDLADALLMPDLRLEIEDLFPKETVIAPGADDVVEPPAEPVSMAGDLYLLGGHRLLVGDSTSPEDVARLLDGERPRLLLTDPPYGVELDMEWRDRAGLNALGPAEKSYMRGEGHRNTSLSGDTRADWSEAFGLVPSLDVAYVWHASAFAAEVALGLRRIGFEIKQQIIWRKPHFALSRQHYHWQHEPCWYARKPGSAPFRGSRDQSTIWDAASPKMLMAGGAEEKWDHPTQKPCLLYTRPLDNHLARGECFYEPFAGSGTAIAAAEQSGHRCLAIEIDPRFADVVVSRWSRLTGRGAEVVRRAADGTQRAGWPAQPGGG